jgi:L-histidine N-alpha-methyltransferase
MNEQFLNDVVTGLSAKTKKLNSKYFYDDEGDVLFQKIMQSEEYYLTDCEYEIFQGKSPALAGVFLDQLKSFELLELGAGDASKTKFLLEALVNRKADFTYMPIDISGSMITYLEDNLPSKIPGLKVTGLNGEYFPMLEKVKTISCRKKAVLFLGGNIGNMDPDDALAFCKQLHASLNPGDYVLMGFDLRKNPHAIFNAYNDKAGYTKAFNLNLLKRINNDLGANFQLADFEHYNSYDPLTGACRSFLVSLKAQQVNLAGQAFHFKANEVIDMEISQKYSMEEIYDLGNQANFEVVETFFDSKEWFLDMLWKVT